MKLDYVIICSEEYLIYAKKAMFSLRLKDQTSTIHLFIYTNKSNDLRIYEPIIVTKLDLPEFIEANDIGTYVCTRRAEIMRNFCTINDKSITFFLDADTLFLRRIKSSYFKATNKIFVNVTQSTNPVNRIFLSHFIVNIDKTLESFSQIRDQLEQWALRLNWNELTEKLIWFDDQKTFGEIFLNINENKGMNIVKLKNKYGAYGAFLHNSFLISGAAGSKLNTFRSITPYGFCNSLISKAIQRPVFINNFFARFVLNSSIKIGYLAFIYLRLIRLTLSSLKQQIQ